MLRIVLALVVAVPATILMPSSPAVIETDDPVILAAGDIACSPNNANFADGAGTATHCRQAATANLVAHHVAAGADRVLLLGDVQYSDGRQFEYEGSYLPTWGAFLDITRAAAGNHDVEKANETYYWDVFGDAAGARGRGYYSFDLGAWHIIALNSNCLTGGSVTNPCEAASEQMAWLREDLLLSSGTRCTLAFWHYPLRTFGHHTGTVGVAPFWEALYDGGADVILNAHDHVYERIKPVNPAMVPDGARGIRTFVVGTGGAEHYEWSTEPQQVALAQQLLENRDKTHFGVLRLTLHAYSYSWAFIGENGPGDADGVILDSGTANCHL